MTYEWTLMRQPANGQVLLGTLETAGGASCCTLERLGVCIPEGRYRLTLTVSGRATAGSLWSPYDDHRLPELADVPDRSAIRLHAGNHIMDTEGCILVGAEHDATELMESRPALTKLVNDLRDYEASGDDCWLTVQQG